VNKRSAMHKGKNNFFMAKFLIGLLHTKKMATEGGNNWI
jgi:hypothetical protein